MTKPPKLVSPATDEERQIARVAAETLRAVLAGKLTPSGSSTAHIDFSRPRRGEWWTTWANLPGLTRISSSVVDGSRYQHVCLPGWEYAYDEIESEMIPDLEALAERGERPTEATS